MEETGKITAVETQKKNKTRLSVFVDGIYVGSLEEIVWARSGLKVGAALEPARWEELQTRDEARAALDKALRKISSRAHSKADLEKYLAEKGFSEQAVAAAVEKLEGYGYIDDGEYAAMVVRGRMNLRPQGRRSIAGDLKRSGVGEEEISSALEQYSEEDEREAVLRQAEKEMKRTAGESDERKRRAKIYASLARRGFSSDLIQQALRKLMRGASED